MDSAVEIVFFTATFKDWKNLLSFLSRGKNVISIVESANWKKPTLFVETQISIVALSSCYGLS